MASNYNTRPRPAEVALMQGNARLIKHRESFEKMIEDEERLLEDTLEMPLQSEDGENP